MSELRVNKIIPKDGLAASGTSTGAGGGIIQVVSFTYRGQSSGNNGSSYVSTGIKATITPQSSSNKILVQASVMYDVTIGVWAGIRLYRGGNCVTGAIPTGTFYTGYSVIDGKSINANWIALAYQQNTQNHNEQYFLCSFHMLPNLLVCELLPKHHLLQYLYCFFVMPYQIFGYVHYFP